MAITIPIITEFAGAGIDKAIREFKQLETAGEKAQFAIKKAAVPAAAALVAVGAAAFDAVKGALEDSAAQDQLARNIRGVTNASDSAIKKNEDFISSLSMTTATADDELRPALAKLVIGTENLEKAQKGLKLAQDIAAGTGKDLATVSDALSKAYAGNDKGLKALDPRMKSLLKAGIDVEGAMSILADTFGGDAAAAADTASGRFKQFQIGLEETKESIGAALLPAVEALLPFITQLGKWASDHTTTFIAVGAAITTIAVAVIAVNTANKLWAATAVATTAINAALATSFTVLQVATGAIIITAIIAAVVALQVKFNILGKAIDGVAAIATGLFDGMKTGFKVVVDVIRGYIETLVGFYKGLFNGIADIWNNTVGKLSFKIPGWVPGIGGKGFEVPNIPKLAEGGIVTSPTIAMIGERGPEAVVPLTGRNAPAMGNNITINVNGGDPNAVVSALRTYMRQNGSVPIKVSNIY
jgi:hypothetical protein